MSVLPSGYLKVTTNSGGLNGGFIKISPFAVVTKQYIYIKNNHKNGRSKFRKEAYCQPTF